MNAPTSRVRDDLRPVLPVLRDRWSPRAFDSARALTLGELRPAFEAARSSPSANNVQPWRFRVAFRGSAGFDGILACLNRGNRAWAFRAAALVVNIAVLEDDDGAALPWAVYDLGQAVMAFVVQAHGDGLHVHQMGGFDAGALAARCDLPQHQRVVSVSAVGYRGDPEILDEPHRASELAPRDRLMFDDLVRVG